MSVKVDVVLLQSVKGLGNKDDVVSVAIPYAKNVLFAQGKAKVADKAALDTMKQKKDKLQKHEQESQEIFQQVAKRKSEGGSLKIQKKSAPNGHLYEKISVKEIADALYQASQVKVDASRIETKGKIEAIGEATVNIVYK